MVEDVEESAVGVHVESGVVAVHEAGFEVALGVFVGHFEEEADEGAGGAGVHVAAAAHGEHDGLLSDGGDVEGDFPAVVHEHDFFGLVLLYGRSYKFFQGSISYDSVSGVADKPTIVERTVTLASASQG